MSADAGEHMDWGAGFTLVRSPKRRTISLVIKRDGALEVRAPSRAPRKTIDQFVASKASWVARTRAKIARERPPSAPKVFVDGEMHLYLGKSYPLCLTKTGQRGAVLRDNRIHVCVADPSNGEAVRDALARWYARQAKLVFADRFRARMPDAKRIAPDKSPTLAIRQMKRTWGNCRTSGRITLNRDLIKAPMDCLDYVIAHEVCHLKHMNHSKAFYALQESLVPDWRARKAELERVMA